MKFDFIHNTRIQCRCRKFAAAFKQQRDERTLAESGQECFPLRLVFQRRLFPARGKVKSILDGGETVRCCTRCRASGPEIHFEFPD